MAASIPADVIRDILARLPVKDLLRFRCVSKFFRSLIDCSDFSKLHLFHSQNTQSHLYGVSDLNRFEDPQVKLFDVSNTVDSVSVVMVNRPPGSEPRDLWVMLGSCNGLIASSLNGDRGHILFWNPFTGKSKKVASSIPHNFPITYGFGYDPKADDYKLVRITVVCDSEINPNQVTLKAEIYSMKTNSWKEIGNDFVVNSRHGFRSQNFGVLANNALHWMIHDEINDRKIVAFDLVNEDFHYVPVCGRFPYNDWMKLSVVDGCLAMSFRHERYNHVWIMKEYGVKESWTKVFSYLRSMLSYSDNMYPLAYSSGRGKFLFSCSSTWYWYDLIGEKFDPCSNRNCYLRTGKVKIFSGSLLAPDDLVDSKRKQTVLESNKETPEEKRRKTK